MILLLMENIINGEIISDSMEMNQIGLVYLIQRGRKTISDDIQSDIKCQISQILLDYHMIGLEVSDLLRLLQNWVFFSITMR